jgi:hypothetical protein
MNSIIGEAMTRQEQFLSDLEDLCSNYDTDAGEVELYVSPDGPDDVIWVYLPSETGKGGSFILSSDRPYDKGGE